MESQINRELCLLYASESGTSYDLACRVSSLAKRRFLSMTPKGMDDALCDSDVDIVVRLRQLAMANNGLVIFVVSTTGDGEVPKNMENSWRALLKRSIPTNALSGVRFAMYGIGDRGYGHKFCAAARKLDGRLRQLGATPLTERVLGDEQDARGGVLALFAPWLESLWKALLIIHPLPEGLVVSDAPSLDPPESIVTFEAPTSEEPVDRCDIYDSGFQRLGLKGPPMHIDVSSNTRMTAETWSQNVRELSLDVDATWSAGDVAWLLPENNAQSVSDMLTFTQLTPDTVVVVTPTSSGGFVGRCSARELFARVLAIDSLPRPFAFEQLGLCATKEEERDKLLEIGGPEGVDLYHDFCYRERRSWVEVFRDFSSLRPPLDRLLSLIPRLLPRAFSIASPPSHSHVLLSVAVVQYKTPYGRDKEGTCSSWVRELIKGDKVLMWLGGGSFPKSVIDNVATPLVLIGPGTGVAPMRSIALHRSHLRSQSQDSSSHLDDLLFFGCRKRSSDFLFGEELSDIDGLSLHTAFSREQVNTSGGRLYVTHLIKEHGKAVFESINKGGSVLVAGSAGSMPKDVHAAIVSVISEHGDMTLAEASELVKKLERQKRYCVEAYG